MTRQGRSLGKGREGGSSFPSPASQFCSKRSKHARIICQNIETMMSLQLGETVSGFRIRRPVQWVLDTQNPLLFKYQRNTMSCLKSLCRTPSFLRFATALGGKSHKIHDYSLLSTTYLSVCTPLIYRIVGLVLSETKRAKDETFASVTQRAGRKHEFQILKY